MDYESLISKLLPEHKQLLWSKYKDLNFSNNTKYRLIFYEAVAKKYLTK